MPNLCDEMSIKEHVSYNVATDRVDSLEDSYHQWWCVKKDGKARKANRLQLNCSVAGIPAPEAPNHSNGSYEESMKVVEVVGNVEAEQ